jgi:DNA helicase HerA-like ATPase
VTVRVNEEQQERLVRNLLVHIREPGKIIREYVGRVVSGPFFLPDLPQPQMNGADAGTRGPASTLGRRIVSEVEIVGELANDQVRAAQRRPAPGATVVALDNQVTERLLGCGGDMRLGCLSGRDSVLFHLRSQSKGVLPRNVGIFGTVGSGKSNAAQVLIEEATAQGWAAVVVDVEGEYVAMDAPSTCRRLPTF